MVDNAFKILRRRNTFYSGRPTPADQDVAAKNLRAKVYQAICKGGSKWMPPNSNAGQPATAGQPAAPGDAAEGYDIYASSSECAAHGAGTWATPIA
eukprot:7594542-Pyramimonas_sp.AAC.1